MLQHSALPPASVSDRPTRRVIGIVGSYRKLGMVDAIVTEILAAATATGATTEKIYLPDQHIEFCRNCRACLQEPGEQRGTCPIDDDMAAILERLDSAQALVLGAPVNFGNVTAITRQFLERCVGAGYWPWGTAAPKLRQPKPTKPAVLVSSSAAPALIGCWFTGAIAALKDLAKMLGAKPIGTVWMGGVSSTPMDLPPRIKVRSQQFGRRLAQ
jgi:NAD(P)H-dependent FMN reductase